MVGKKSGPQNHGPQYLSSDCLNVNTGLCGHGIRAATFIISQSLNQYIDKVVSITDHANSRGKTKDRFSGNGEIMLDFPVTHPRPYQGVLILYPPINVLVLDIVEADIKNILVDEARLVYIVIDEKKINISALPMH